MSDQEMKQEVCSCLPCCIMGQQWRREPGRVLSLASDMCCFAYGVRGCMSHVKHSKFVDAVQYCLASAVGLVSADRLVLY